jgi:uncharacterized protein HemX
LLVVLGYWNAGAADQLTAPPPNTTENGVMASATEIASWTAAVVGPVGAGIGYFLNWLLKRNQQAADIQSKLDTQTAQIESSIADKYSDRITKLETQVQELFNKLVDKAQRLANCEGKSWCSRSVIPLAMQTPPR